MTVNKYVIIHRFKPETGFKKMICLTVVGGFSLVCRINIVQDRGLPRTAKQHQLLAGSTQIMTELCPSFSCHTRYVQVPSDIRKSTILAVCVVRFRTNGYILYYIIWIYNNNYPFFNLPSNFLRTHQRPLVHPTLKCTGLRHWIHPS